jgi:glycosyltransferase involved in cell wall biosynthesis
MKFNKLSLVIPVYNEERTILQLLAKLAAVPFGIETEVILVDDGSKDKSREILQREFGGNPGYKIMFNEKNMGKSQTVRKGLLASTGDLVVIQDADLEYDPAELKEFVDLFQNSNVDVVYGNRFGKDNKVVYWQNWIGNRSLSAFSSIFTGLRSGMWTSDMEVCYKMVRGDVFRAIAQTIVSKSTFGLEPEVTAKLSRYKVDGKHLRFAQLAISYYPRTLAEGKKMHAVRDGIKALGEILKFNLS